MPVGTESSVIEGAKAGLFERGTGAFQGGMAYERLLKAAKGKHNERLYLLMSTIYLT